MKSGETARGSRKNYVGKAEKRGLGNSGKKSETGGFRVRSGGAGRNVPCLFTARIRSGTEENKKKDSPSCLNSNTTRKGSKE